MEGKRYPIAFNEMFTDSYELFFSLGTKDSAQSCYYL